MMPKEFIIFINTLLLTKMGCSANKIYIDVIKTKCLLFDCSVIINHSTLFNKFSKNLYGYLLFFSIAKGC